MIEIPKMAVTHAGKFHADDVFSAALLLILNPEIKIMRAYEVPDSFEGIAFDLGWGAFDHHQGDAPVRENGVPYAAFGLLWREFGASLVGEEDAARFDGKFVQPLDLDDNTGCGDPVAELIGAFNPSWDSGEYPEKAFWRAVRFARVILKNKLESMRSVQRARAQVLAALEQMREGVVVLERFCPWKMVLEESPALFVVYPSQRGGYSAQAVPVKGGEGALKCPFPARWAGRTEQELAALTGIASLKFCHNSLFLCACGTLEDARAACRLALSEMGL